MTGPPAAADAGRYDAFLSYAREDSDFAVHTLHAGLSSRGLDVWLDREDILGGALWRERVWRGIEACKAFLFVMSPDSVASDACRAELELAVAAHKRIVPIVYRDVEEPEVLPALAEPEWIFLRKEDNQSHGIDQLVEALETDLDWRDQHTRLAGRAREWLDGGRDRSFLLRGRDLRAAEAWAAQQGGHRERPTTEQVEYIARSRQAAGRRARALVGALAAGLVIAIGLGVLALIQRNQAVANQAAAQSEADANAAQLELAVDPGKAVADALNAVRERDTFSADLILRKAVAEDQFRGLLLGQTGVRALAFDPADSDLLISGANDGTVRVWNAATDRSEAVLPGPTGERGLQVDDLAFSSDGSLIAAAYNDGTVRVWKRQGFDLAFPALVVDRAAAVNQISFNPKAPELLATSGNGQAYVYSIQTGKLINKIAPPLGGGAAIVGSYSPDGTRVLLSYQDGLVVLHLSGGPVVTLGAQGSTVNEAAFSPDGQRIVVALKDGTTQLATGTGQLVADLHVSHGVTVSGGFGKAAESAAFSPDGALAAVGYSDGEVGIFNGRSGAFENLIRTGLSTIPRVRFSPVGTFLATEADDGTIRVWNPLSGEQLSLLTHGLKPLASLAYSADGSLLAAGETAGGVDVWEPLPGRVLAHYRPVASAAFSPDGKFLVLAGVEVGLLSSSTGRFLRTVSVHAGSYQVPVFSRDGSLLAVPARTSTRVISLRSRRIVDLAASADPNAQAGFLTPTGDFSPDDKFYAQGSSAGSVTVWSVATGDEVTHLRGHTGPVNVVRYSPSGRLLASAGSDGISYIESADGRGPVRVLHSGGSVAGLSFSPDGRLLATVTLAGPGGNELQLWNALTGRELGQPQEGMTQFVRFIEDGKELIAGTIANGVGLWKVTPGGLQAVGTFGDNRPLTAAEASGASELGGELLTSEFGAERIYSLGSGQLIGELGVTNHYQVFTSNASGTRVLTVDLPALGGGTYTARLYACDACGSLGQVEAAAQRLVNSERGP